MVKYKYIKYAKYILICYTFGRHPQAAINYTFLQTQSRAKRMRQSRRSQLPRDIHELSEMLSDSRNATRLYNMDETGISTTTNKPTPKILSVC